MSGLERTDLANIEFEATVSRYERAQRALETPFDPPEFFADRRRVVEEEAWAGLMESVEGGWLTQDEAERMYAQWFSA